MSGGTNNSTAVKDMRLLYERFVRRTNALLCASKEGIKRFQGTIKHTYNCTYFIFRTARRISRRSFNCGALTMLSCAVCHWRTSTTLLRFCAKEHCLCARPRHSLDSDRMRLCKYFNLRSLETVATASLLLVQRC